METMQKKLMIKEGFSKDKLSCIYNSLDYEEQLNLRNQQVLSGFFSGAFYNAPFLSIILIYSFIYNDDKKIKI